MSLTSKINDPSIKQQLNAHHPDVLTETVKTKGGKVISSKSDLDPAVLAQLALGYFPPAESPAWEAGQITLDGLAAAMFAALGQDPDFHAHVRRFLVPGATFSVKFVPDGIAYRLDDNGVIHIVDRVAEARKLNQQTIQQANQDSAKKLETGEKKIANEAKRLAKFAPTIAGELKADASQASNQLGNLRQQLELVTGQ